MAEKSVASKSNPDTQDDVLEKIQRLSSKNMADDAAFFEKFLYDFCHSGSHFSQENEKFSALYELYMQWLDSFSDEKSVTAEERCKLLLRNYSDLYAAAYAFAGAVDETFRYIIPLLNQIEPSAKEKISSEFPIAIGTDYMNYIALRLPLPQRKKLTARSEYINSHSSAMREALRYSLAQQELPLKQEEISIHFLFNYALDDSVSDHDNLAVSGWIDDITWALGIDDNGISCATHFWSARNPAFPRGTYILVTSQDQAPLMKSDIFEFFT